MILIFSYFHLGFGFYTTCGMAQLPKADSVDGHRGQEGKNVTVLVIAANAGYLFPWLTPSEGNKWVRTIW